MSITKRVFNNIFWLVLSEISSRTLIFLGTIYLARILGKAGFGLYSLSLAVGVCVWMVADMGVTGYGTREIARNKEKATELYNTLNSLRFFLAISLFLIFCGVLYLINIPLEKKLILLAGAFYAVAYSLSTDWVFRGLEKMQYLVLGGATAPLFFLGCIYLLVNTPSDTLFAAVIYSCSFIVGSLSFIFLLHKKLKMPFSLRISFASWRVHIKESFYFAVNGVFDRIAIFIPIFFMGFWSTNEELGIFSAPHRLTMMGIHMGGLILSGLYPTLSGLYVTDRDNFKKTHARFQELIVAITMPVCIIATVFGKDIIVLFFGALYADSGGILSVLIWLIFLAVVRRTFGSALLSAGFQRFNMIATGTGVVIITLTSIALIPKYSGYGAVWALIGGEIFTLVIMCRLFRKKVYHSDIYKSYFVKVFFASIVMGLLLINLPFSVIPSVLIGLLVYGLLSLSIGIVSKKSIQQVYRMMVKR